MSKKRNRRRRLEGALNRLNVKGYPPITFMTNAQLNAYQRDQREMDVLTERLAKLPRKFQRSTSP